MEHRYVPAVRNRADRTAVGAVETRAPRGRMKNRTSEPTEPGRAVAEMLPAAKTEASLAEPVGKSARSTEAQNWVHWWVAQSLASGQAAGTTAPSSAREAEMEVWRSAEVAERKAWEEPLAAASSRPELGPTPGRSSVDRTRECCSSYRPLHHRPWFSSSRKHLPSPELVDRTLTKRLKSRDPSR